MAQELAQDGPGVGGGLAANFVCDSEGGDGLEELTREKTKPGREGSHPLPARP